MTTSCWRSSDAAGIPAQLGGGFRTRDTVTRWIDHGAGRIVLGTMALHDPDTVRELAKYHPDQIVVAVDVYQGRLMTAGWCEPSVFGADEFIRAFDGVPLAGLIVTDIDADIEESDGSLGVISGLAAKTRHPVIARGTVRGIDDVARLRFIPNIAGTLIGRRCWRGMWIWQRRCRSHMPPSARPPNSSECRPRAGRAPRAR